MAPFRKRQLSFADLDGWAGDDHAAAFAAFRVTADRLDGFTGPLPDADCSAAAARTFFESRFDPVLIEDGGPPLLTGYYELELAGSRRQEGRFRHPLYRMPAAPPPGGWPTRREIETGAALAGQGLEFVWIDDPVDVYFLHVQGSGRVRLPDGTAMRVGFAGRNGHPYASIGKALAAIGALAAETVTADRVRDWLRANPRQGAALMRTNDSFIFFREVTGLPDTAGPIGALGRPVTPGRSLAVDPAAIPLGAPVWVERQGTEPDRRLAVAQDVGAAIRGAQRADLFVGTGAAAGLAAGRIADPCRLVALLPKPGAAS